MNEHPTSPEEPVTPQPVAYDAQGRPLYAHPPVVPPQPLQIEQQPQVVHIARPLEPEKPVMSAETQRLHERSKNLYPFLNLSEGEYVIRAVRRHPIGLIVPLGIGTLLLGIILAFIFNYDLFSEAFAISGPFATVNFIMTPLLVLAAIIALGMFITYYVYVNNKFFLTNESVIQEIQVSLFSRHEQTVSLSNIEDASFTQSNVIQQIFNYGDIRLSTEGDETTYRFSYVANPKDHIATLNNAVEAFKNGRPVSDN